MRKEVDEAHAFGISHARRHRAGVARRHGRSRPGIGAGQRRAGREERDRTRGSARPRSEEHTSELQSLMRISYAVFCLKKKTTKTNMKQRKDTTTKTTILHNTNLSMTNYSTNKKMNKT